MEICLPVTHLDEDYQSSGIILVYPHKIKGYTEEEIKELKQFYKDYISIIPEYIEITWIVKDNFAKNEVKELMKGRKHYILNLYYIEDIWCGDWVPFIAVDTKDNYLATQFIYPVSNNDDKAGQFIATRFYEYPLLKITLKLDAGCIELNAGEFLLISKKIFEKNPEKTEKEITDILLKNYNVKTVYYFDFDSVLGHADLLFRGLRKNVWVYSSFNGKVDISVSNLIKKIKEDWPNCKWYEICNEKLGLNDGEDYTGNILDFMVMGNHIIFPIFSDSSKEAMKILMDLLPIGVEIIPFEAESIKNLYKHGGGLYCITSSY